MAETRYRIGLSSRLGDSVGLCQPKHDFVDPTSMTPGTFHGRPRVYPSLTARLTQPGRVVPT